MLRRRTLLCSAAAVLPLSLSARAAPPPAAALSANDQADIARIETYLNGLKSLKAHFMQVAGDGGISQGTAWLERPGRMRFQYDPPAPFLLIASHGQLSFHDASLGQTSNIPLSRTPLGILLADHVQLSGPVTVTAVQRLPGQVQVTLVRTNSPGDGSLTLIFADQPLALRQWTVVDAQRRETHVTLNNVQLGGTFDPQLFEQIFVPGAKPG
ncbi:MAG TPA: outer membrane lipoprotein carrier protein LolA [Rhodopila sp.]|jgi:outer membrane lipoprotein-sorting protein|nr:outer membrane lipoprotein carrier protein LolA [Rhodopila sp.]